MFPSSLETSDSRECCSGAGVEDPVNVEERKEFTLRVAYPGGDALAQVKIVKNKMTCRRKNFVIFWYFYTT